MSQISILFCAEAKDMRHQGTGEQEEQKVRVNHRVQNWSRSSSVTESASRGTCVEYMLINYIQERDAADILRMLLVIITFWCTNNEVGL